MIFIPPGSVLFLHLGNLSSGQKYAKNLPKYDLDVELGTETEGSHGTLGGLEGGSLDGCLLFRADQCRECGAFPCCRSIGTLTHILATV